MTRFIAILLAFFLFGASVSAQEQFAPEIDTASIKTYSDFNAAKSEAWQRYSDRKSAAWNIYDEAKNTAWKEYSTTEHEALMKLRAADYSNYIVWLDAREVGDYDLRFKLEDTVPAIKEHNDVKEASFAAYKQVDAAAYGVYLITEANATAARLQEEAMAEAAYKMADAAN